MTLKACPYRVETRNKKVYYCRCLKVRHANSDSRFIAASQCTFCSVPEVEVKPSLVLPEPDLTDPGLGQKTKNFLEAIAIAAADNFKETTDAIQAVRWAICEECGEFDDTERYCTNNKCGCKAGLIGGGMLYKISLASQKCPSGNWGAAKTDDAAEYKENCRNPLTGDNL